MLDLYKDFSLNGFYVFFIPTLVFVLIRKSEHPQAIHRLYFGLVCAFSLVLSMSVPVTINGLTYDFRAVPLTVGSLYGGLPVSACLYALLIGYRYLSGYPNTIEYVVAIVPTFLAVASILQKIPELIRLGQSRGRHGDVLPDSMFTLVNYLLFIGDQGTLLESEFAMTFGIVLIQTLLTGAYISVLEYFVRTLRFQEEIRKTEKLKLVSNLAASVAHEVRNPLTTVRGFIQLLGRDELKPLTRSKYQKICLEELDRAQQIISDYLTLAKPDNEIIEDVSLHSEIRYVVNVLTSFANMQNVQIVTELCEQDHRLAGESAKLRQAVINLCKNSIEAMPDGGKLTLETRSNKSDFVIRIRDTGIGMTEDQLNRLGIPFYSTKDKGTGLGTMVSFSIIRNLHGHIDITSKPNEGSTFAISFREDSRVKSGEFEQTKSRTTSRSERSSPALAYAEDDESSRIICSEKNQMFLIISSDILVLEMAITRFGPSPPVTLSPLRPRPRSSNIFA